MFTLPQGNAYQLLVEDYPAVFSCKKGSPITFRSRSEPGYRIDPTDTGVTIAANTTADRFRALGRLLQNPALDEPVEEQPMMTFRALMMDCSRNAVYRVDTVKWWIRRLALLGYNYLCLYTEETYEVPGQPLIGYLRGRYTQKELRELDRYAASFDIEMFPCIQLLGHLERMLFWPSFGDIVDTPAVVNPKLKETHDLLEQMLDAATRPFKSKLVHVGLDETHGLGRGKTMEPGKVNDPRKLYIDHVKRVGKWLKQRGLQGMMWADMLLGYSGSKAMTDEQADALPDNIEMIYWDYYRDDPGVYTRNIRKYHKWGYTPMFAPAGWGWDRFWSAWPHVMRCLPQGMMAAKSAGLQRALMTTWGDDGAEVAYDSHAPALTLFAEHCWRKQVDDDHVQQAFEAVFCTDFARFILPAEMDIPDPWRKAHVTNSNPTKCLLWDDPLLGIYCGSLHARKMTRLGSYYKSFVKKLDVPESDNRLEQSLQFAQALAEAVSVKADLFADLYDAYHAGNKRRLRTLRDTVLKCCATVSRLEATHRSVWQRDAKNFGWEVIEKRYAAVESRLITTAQTLDDYLDGRIDSIEELEPQRVPAVECKPPQGRRYQHLTSPGIAP